jgi:tRNA/tmRNA/rRNA uracil-C5-methylase (TrmA/RlmC/RlmD family)/alkylated DNA repair dioxygenase AlkB
MTTTAFDYCLPNMAMTYDEQFDKKKEYAKNLFTSDDITNHESIPTNYRNKLRFTIGYNEDYTKVVIGYNNPKVKPSIVYSALELPHLSKKMCEMIGLFENYLEGKFKDIPYEQKLLESRFVNLFGNINIRTSFNIDENMVIIHLDRISNRSTIDDLIKTYTDMYYEFRGMITSFYIIDNDRKINLGKPFISEKLFDLNSGESFDFRITELSFFQTNTHMTNIMYSRIKELMKKYSTDSDVLFDLCCGTGTIGIYCSSLCKKVIGIDVCESSIEDANRNAKLNGIKNCDFICNKIENVFDSLLDTYKPLNKFIIIDPPRSGLHGNMTQLINDSGCNYVIYVSCNQETMMRDIALMPNYKIADKDMYDMYPFTDHVEVSCVLERIDKVDIIKPFEYVPNVFHENYFEELRDEITWKQDYFTINNNGIPSMIRERRLTALQSVYDTHIEYSNKTMEPTPFTKIVQFVKDTIESRFRLIFDSCLINYYQNQEDYMRFHKDDTGVTKSTNIITVSFGESRNFQVRLRADKDIKYYYELNNGDVFRMFGNCQDLFDHSIPPVPNGIEKGGRISLTFRVLRA